MKGEGDEKPCAVHGEGAETRGSQHGSGSVVFFGARLVAARGLYASPGHTSPRGSAIPAEARWVRA